MLTQQVQAYQQTGALIGEAILRVIKENRQTLLIDDQTQTLIENSQQTIDERQQYEQQLIEAEETARQRELKKAQQLEYTQRQRAIVLTIGLVVAVILGGLSFFFFLQSNKNLSEANAASTMAVEQANIALARQLFTQARSTSGD